MPRYPPEKIYAAAGALLPELEQPLRGQVQALLQQAAAGTPTDLDLLDLLTRDDATRQRLNALLEGEERTAVLGPGGVAPPSGGGGYYPSPLSELPSTSGLVFVCPEKGCPTRYVIGEAGETPPRCEMHQKDLVPQEK